MVLSFYTVNGENQLAHVCRGSMQLAESGAGVVCRWGGAMKPTLAPGLKHDRSFAIDAPRVIEFMGHDCRVYATPKIVHDLEYTCRDWLLSHLDPGEDSVGTRVELKHLAPALFGATVRVDIEVTAIDGRRVTFSGKAFDITTGAAELIAAGTHERFVVDTAKVRERLLKRRREQRL
jgi:predicted thioesterase